jgi:serine/threonine-protein kinase RsbW
MDEGRERVADDAGVGRVSLRLRPEKQELRRLARAVDEFSSAHSLPPRVARALALVLEEAVTNVLFYAFDEVSSPAREIAVTVERRGEAVQATVRDNGRPFDPTAHERTDLPTSLDDLEPGGLGIRMIRRMTDRVAYRRDDGCNLLELELAI